MILFNAWMSDDAYITLRTVDNFVNGYGLTWNPGERVQAYTHPLWMFLLSAAYALTREAYFTSLVLSWPCSFLAVVWAGYGLFRQSFERSLLLVILAASISFLDYTTSGLENPLSYLLMVAFCWLYLSQQAVSPPRHLLGLSLVTALVTLNRLDLILLCLPALLERFWVYRPRRVWLVLVLGLSPLIAWVLFSLVYYGFPFPNTAYARLNTGIPANSLMAQGLMYVWDVLCWDAVTLLIPIAAIVLAAWRGSRTERSLMLGCFLYLLYVVWIGGDFMRGRFFTLPLLIGALVFVRLLPPIPGKFKPIQAFILVGIVLIGVWARFQQSSTPPGEPAIFDSGIADERQFYFRETGLVHLKPARLVPNHPWAAEGLALRRSGKSIRVETSIGMRGFFAGPNVWIVDQYALADPLLARLPVEDLQDWRIGHFSRTIPPGYLETLRSGENLIANPDLAEYFRQLSLLTRGAYFTTERWAAIWALNTGQQNHLLDSYLNRAFSP
jgi:arabinofuranosyltransferase